MKKSAFILAVVMCVALIAHAPVAWAGVSRGDSFNMPGKAGVRPGAEYVPGELLIKLKRGNGIGGLKELKRKAGVLAIEHVPIADIEKVKVSNDRLEAALAKLRSSDLVEYAEPNYIRHTDWVPNDYYFNQVQWQWNLSSTNDSDIHMVSAWDKEQGGDPATVVAVVDTGIAYEDYGIYSKAPDLAGTTFTSGHDFINNDNHADDDNGHGTHVTGTIAQSTNNTLGCAGIAFNCTIMPVKVLDRQGSGADSEISQGIMYAADRGADVINMSFSGMDASQVLGDAVSYAAAKGAVLCGAAGNENQGFVGYPAGYQACISVGATTWQKQRAYYSNYGTALDVVAPGGDNRVDRNGDGKKDGIIQQTYRIEGDPTSTFAFMNYQGTSMACPHVVSTAALVKSRHPNWSTSDIRSVIASTCRDLGDAGWDPEYGFGLIDAAAAVTAARPRIQDPVVSSIEPDHGKSDTAVSGVKITGTGFTPSMKVALFRADEGDVTASDVTVSGSTEITCSFDLSGLQAGPWNLGLENSGLESGVSAGAFVVDPSNNRTWYLAEGSTSFGFEEFILVQNPNDVAANVQVTYMTPGGAVSRAPLAVPPDSRATINVNQDVPDTDVSAQITADQDIICERSMYWNNRIEGADSIGVQAPSYTWYLAEGTTAFGFDTFLLIQNPSQADASVLVTYMTKDGPVEKPMFVVPANTRYSINVRDDLPDQDVSFMVVSDQRVIAERSMYWDNRRGGHDSIGTATPALNWYLAEGSTSWGYDEYVLLQNPGSSAANIEMTYMTPNGPLPQPAVSLAAGSRMTVHVNDALPGSDVSVQVTADRGIVAERSMYWDNGTGKGGHDSIGVIQPRNECFLAEGTTNWGFDEWVLIQNPNETPADIGIEYMTATGLVPRNGFTLAANSRVTVHVNNDLPPVDVSTRVSSNIPVIAERSMYWNSNGAGHVSQGLAQ